MNEMIVHMISMATSMTIVNKLSQKYSWNKRIWNMMEHKYGIDPSYYMLVGIFIAISISTITVVLSSFIGFDRYTERIIHGVALGTCLIFIPQKKKDELREND